MNALLIIVALALFFYFMHRVHGQVGGCGMDHGDKEARHAEGEKPPASASPVQHAGHSGPNMSTIIVIALLSLLPLMLLHGVIPPGSFFHQILFWAALLLAILCFPIVWKIEPLPTPKKLSPETEAEQKKRETNRREEQRKIFGLLEERVSKEMEIDAMRYEGDLVSFEGRLLGDSEAAYPRLTKIFAEVNRAPRLLEGQGGRSVVVAAPISTEEAKPIPQNIGLALFLFAATLATTTWVGALQQGVNLLEEPGRFTIGLPYSLALMAILVIHELGHYVAGRLHGIKVTLPYFIPVPLALGTFGAFIQIRGAIPDRRKLFDVGVAGPLAGLAIALPALYFGLRGTAAAPAGTGVSLSSSMLLSWLYSLANGEPVAPDHVIMLSPLAFAGWLGVLVTGLNLIPVGQLDGGHVAYALLGRRHAETLGWVAIFLLLALGIFYWSGWLTWAILIFFVGAAKHEPALNELAVLGWRRRAVGVFTFVLLFLIMAPVPHRFMDALGIMSPYIPGAGGPML